MLILLRTLLCSCILLLLVWITVQADDPPSATKLPVFSPVVQPVVPAASAQTSTDIDRFILAGLQAKKLTMQPKADRATLFRRVAFDLTGLPPTTVELDLFLRDTTPAAYDNMIDRYLASPQYGVHWGKFWLDAAGYADSNGYFNADSDRPLAWKYRDYVIQSFNSDKPFDVFVREQLAGDELVQYTPQGDVTPAMIEGLTATHFLRNAPDGSGESDGNPDEVRTDRYTVLEGNLQNMMNCLLGLTIQCARCHDHKFEPISQKEYYSLQALFFPVYNPVLWTKPNDRLVLIGNKATLAAQQRLRDQVDKQIKILKDSLTAFAEPLREQFLDERLKGLEVPVRGELLEALKMAKDKRSSKQTALLKKHKKLIEISDDALAARFPEYGAFKEQTQRALAAREKDLPPTPEKIAAYVETDAKPAVHHVLKRGLHGQPGEEVQPGALACLSQPGNQFQLTPPAPGQVSTGRRTAFARWVTSPANPLFARVIVNRIWQQHFGTGIVATPDNLGYSGSKPSHPELLDYLAHELVRNGWRIKAMHRLIMKSAVYQQSSTPAVGTEQIDSENRLLSHYPLRRLPAEAVRDAMLMVAGELDERLGGPYVPSVRLPDGVVEVDEKTPGARRRSVYLQQRRTQVVTLLQLFDAPALVSTCGKRTPSTVPLQSLVLLNSLFARQRSQAFATRLLREADKTTTARIDLAYRLVCSRLPRDDERLLCEKFLQAQQAARAAEPQAEKLAWIDLCQMLLASNAFLYVE